MPLSKVGSTLWYVVQSVGGFLSGVTYQNHNKGKFFLSMNEQEENVLIYALLFKIESVVINCM